MASMRQGSPPRCTGTIARVRRVMRLAMETGMEAEVLCKSYLNALDRSDLSAVCSLFTADAVAHSPLYGVRPAREFYAELFAGTSRPKPRS